MAIKLTDKNIDAEMKQFQADLLQSVAQMKRGAPHEPRACW